MSLRHAVLGLLAYGPASGYDLLKTFDQSLANVWPATQSQLYTELGRLTDGGLVTVQAEGPRGRKEYAITDAGREEFHHWLTEVEPERPRRDGMLLRVFFLDQVEPDKARTFLERRAEAAAAYHDQLLSLRGPVTDDTHPLAVNGRLALEYGIRVTDTIHHWASWAADRVNSTTYDKTGKTSRTGRTSKSREGGDGARGADGGDGARGADGGDALGAAGPVNSKSRR
ncbi:PadR family transcriptional regulator [Streptomyces sp. ICBB 8177]|uniref:PadR family transcriptional regulator n=1 Tax=Streptomyces sp. ICBB 8177 TaxID=563922 RepID=UPI000D676952|nr:PadR family transcriptional regulator [Streptomyces sp. ICBB 8177]PWI41403.1 PadR family transcriptional regulator [Streptomyces sp. ICBB 8177]